MNAVCAAVVQTEYHDVYISARNVLASVCGIGFTQLRQHYQRREVLHLVCVLGTTTQA